MLTAGTSWRRTFRRLGRLPHRLGERRDRREMLLFEAERSLRVQRCVRVDREGGAGGGENVSFLSVV